MTFVGVMLIGVVFGVLLIGWAACASAGHADEELGAKEPRRRR